MKRPGKKIRVFQGMVNYGTQAGLYARALREKGIPAVSVSRNDRFKRLIDIELYAKGNFAQKLIKHSINYLILTYCFFKYNTFHFYFGTTLFPRQLDLQFYKYFNKKVVFHYLGKDVKLYKESIERYDISNMAYSCGTTEEALKQDKKKKKRLQYETQFASKQFVCSPIYSEFVPNSILLPLAIDLTNYQFQPKEPEDKLVIMHAPTNRANKGTEFIIAAIDKLEELGYNIHFDLCENITHDTLKKKYIECDIFIDQVLGGYGTAAIEAMAIGRPTISYLRDVHFNNITFPGGVPIIVAHSKNIFDILKNIIDNKNDLKIIGLKSREFVEKNHDVKVLTDRLINYYKEIHKID